MFHFYRSTYLEYVQKIPDVTYYGVDEMCVSERNEFLAWYEGHKDVVFDNKRVLEAYCQYDVSDLREACRVLRREFIQIGNIKVFLESVKIALACNKEMRKRILKPNTICLIPTGRYTGNVNYSNKGVMWQVYREENDVCKIRDARNGPEYRLPELPRLSVDGFCAETRTVYEFFGCLYHGHTCLSFRDVTTLGGDTLAQRYEQTMARLQRITGARYTVEVVRE